MSDDDASSASENEGRPDKKSWAPRFYDVKGERHSQACFDSVSLAKEDALPLGERVVALPDEHPASCVPKGVKVGSGGSHEISFVSRSKAKYQENDDDDKDKHARRNKKSMQSLGLKPKNYEKRSRGGRGGRGRGRGRGRGGG